MMAWWRHLSWSHAALVLVGVWIVALGAWALWVTLKDR